MWARALAYSAALLTLGCAGHCGARGGLPPNRPPLVKAADGKEYYLVDKGAYKAFYDKWGRLQRIEYDSNGDGRPDQYALHENGQKHPHEVDVDQDFDGKTDRWEEYDQEGHLIRLGLSRKNTGRPDEWTTLGPKGETLRKDYDDDGDGRPERSELFGPDGRVEKVELDTDRKGRADRIQTWKDGHLVSEEIDTDGDGRPDRRLRYGPDGRVVGMEPVGPAK